MSQNGPNQYRPDPKRSRSGLAERFGVSLESPLVEQWFDLGTRAAAAARGPRPAAANRSLGAAVESEPQSPLAPVYLLWMATNLERQGLLGDAVAAFDRTLAAVDDADPSGEPWDVRGAALRGMARAHERGGDIGAAIHTLGDLASSQADDPLPLYQAGLLAERAGRPDDARGHYLAAADRPALRRAGEPADLARRAAQRLDQPSTAFRPTLASLVNEAKAAIHDQDGRRLAAVRSNTHFTVGPVGGEAAFEELGVADALISELTSRRISVRRALLGSGGKRYLQTRGWKSSLFRGDVLLVLTHSPRGWQWSGIALAHPTEEWVDRWRPAKVETNQPLPFPLKAPWPAGQSFMAGGLVDFSLKTASIAALGIFGAALAYYYSRNACGFGPRGFYYNSLFSHKEEDAFAIDFTRYKYGSPFNNISEGTPVLAAADGVVDAMFEGASSGDDSLLNHVAVSHPDPATGMRRFVSRYLHLAGPNLVPVNIGMPVAVGNRLGLMDDTGISRLHHLHFSIHDLQAPYPNSTYGASVRPTPMDGQTLGDGASGKCIRSTNIETQPPTWLDDVGDPSSFASQHYVHTETADGLHLYTLTGVVLLHMKGTGRDWLRAQVNLGITVPEIPPGAALRLVHWAPFVTPNAIQNDDVANWAGWAVDWFRVADPYEPIRQQITVETGVAVRDSDGHLLRLGYEVTLAGTYAEAPFEPEPPIIR